MSEAKAGRYCDCGGPCDLCTCTDEQSAANRKLYSDLRASRVAKKIAETRRGDLSKRLKDQQMNRRKRA